MRGRLKEFLTRKHALKFQSTPPCGGDENRNTVPSGSSISIHAPLRGRRDRLKNVRFLRQFQSTPPCGGDIGNVRRDFSRVISIHAPLRGRLGHDTLITGFAKISIHAPLRGRLYERRGIPTGNDFNPRPLAGATFDALLGGDDVQFQSTPPCGGDQGDAYAALVAGISIHAPLRGRPDSITDIAQFVLFQSTPPCGGDCYVLLLHREN